MNNTTMKTYIQYNKNLPKKKWDFYEWQAKWQRGMINREKERTDNPINQ